MALRSLVVLAALFALSLAVNLLQNDAQLVLLNSTSAVSIATFVEYPELADALQAQTEGCFNSAFLIQGAKRFLVQTYENLYPANASTNPLFVLYDTTSDGLAELSRIYCPPLVTSTNAIVSPNAALRYVAYGSAIPVFDLPIDELGFIPQVYLIPVYQYSIHGVFNPTPVVQFPLYLLDPNFYNQTIAYNGIGGVSDNGLYLVATYALGTIPTVITGQKYNILKVQATSAGAVTGLTSVASSNTTPTGVPGLYSFPQTLRMWQDSSNANLYHLIIAENSWNFPFITGLTSQVSYYRFHVVAGTLVYVASQLTSGYIQGLGVDIDNGFVYAATTAAVPVGAPSVLQTPNAPWFNGAVDPQNNLRVYSLNTAAGTLDYVGGVNLQEDAIQVRPSNDGSLIAVTSAPASEDDIFNTEYNALGSAASHYAPNVVSLYSVHGNYGDGSNFWLRLESSVPAAPLSFCLAFSADDARLAVGGEPTYRNNTANFLATGQDNVQLYSIVC